MRILGIDPGLANTGWGVIEENNLRYRPVSFGTITTKTSMRKEERIFTIARKLGELSASYEVDLVGIEDIFFAQNVSSAITVAKVIGAVIQQMTLNGLEVAVFTPLQIKMAVTGMGTAEKKQVQQMVRLLLKLEEIPRPDHAADSLAVAICLASQLKSFKRKLH
ncbi:MAG: crossover junction endodeoxyribonuclease RuvC [Sphaerochaetaceae bacterium]|nr:crossover junction endodeoxyribonuclease RuvC [Sphaerochaetaceae bacterium]MDC7247362.1 crossover junction endodeoxyribonuclease RuvC [Sphaerochaetaceae bacterium]